MSQKQINEDQKNTKISLGINSRIISKSYSLVVKYLANNLYVFADRGDSIFTYNSQTQQIIDKIQMKQNYGLSSVIMVSSSKNKNSIFLFLNDFQTVVLDFSLKILTYLNIPTFKYSLDIIFNDRISSFILLKSQTIQIVKVQIHTNHTRKGSSPVSYQFKQFPLHSIKCNIQFYQRITLIRQHFVILFNNQSVELHDLSQYDSISMKNTTTTIKNIVSLPNTITSVTLIEQRKVIICGTDYGIIKAYKIGQKKELFELNYHTKRVLDIFFTNSSIISVSADNLMQIINLETMQNTQTFKLNHHCKQAKFFSQNCVFTLSSKNSLIFNSVCLLHNLIYNHKSSVYLALVSADNHTFVLSDRSIVCINKDKIMSNCFVPPRGKQILSIILNPYQINSHGYEYWLLNDKSQIYKYYQTKDKTQIREIIKMEKFKDKFNKICSYAVNSMVFISSVPVNYDADIKQKSYEKNMVSLNDAKPICFGTQQGALLICYSLNIEQIICKLTPFISKVENIIDLRSDQGSFLVSFSQRQMVIIHLFCDKEPIVFNRTILEKGAWLSRINLNKFAIIDKNSLGLVYSQKNQIYCSSKGPLLHENAITVVSYFDQQNIIIVGDDKGSIYIWGQANKLIKKIQISSQTPIEYVGMLKNNCLIFGYQNKLCSLQIEIEERQEKMKNNLIEFKNGYKQGMFKKTIYLFNLNNVGNKQRFSNYKNRELSLPRIYNNYNFESLANGLQQRKDYQKQKLDQKLKSKTRKSRIKKVQLLFHFPNTQIYSELIKMGKIE